MNAPVDIEALEAWRLAQRCTQVCGADPGEPCCSPDDKPLERCHRTRGGWRARKHRPLRAAEEHAVLQQEARESRAELAAEQKEVRRLHKLLQRATEQLAEAQVELKSVRAQLKVQQERAADAARTLLKGVR